MKIKVSGTNPNKAGGKSVIRIYLDSVLIVEEFVPKRNPVTYVKGLRYSKHLTSIELQLLPHGLTLQDVELR